MIPRTYKGVGQFFNMSWVTEYSYDSQISYKTKSKSEPKLEQKIATAAEPIFFSANSEGFIQP